MYARSVQYKVMQSVMLASLAQMVEAVLAQLLAGNFYRCVAMAQGAVRTVGEGVPRGQASTRRFILPCRAAHTSKVPSLLEQEFFLRTLLRGQGGDSRQTESPDPSGSQGCGLSRVLSGLSRVFSRLSGVFRRSKPEQAAAASEMQNPVSPVTASATAGEVSAPPPGRSADTAGSAANTTGGGGCGVNIKDLLNTCSNSFKNTFTRCWSSGSSDASRTADPARTAGGPHQGLCHAAACGSEASTLPADRQGDAHSAHHLDLQTTTATSSSAGISCWTSTPRCLIASGRKTPTPRTTTSSTTSANAAERVGIVLIICGAAAAVQLHGVWARRGASHLMHLCNHHPPPLLQAQAAGTEAHQGALRQADAPQAGQDSQDGQGLRSPGVVGAGQARAGRREPAPGR